MAKKDQKKIAEALVEPAKLSKEEKQNAVKIAMANIEKAFGKGSILKHNSERLKIECISSGNVSLDAAMGGGFPRGRISEVLGMEAAGKSTLALSVAAQAQKADGIVAYIDVENELNMDYAASLGVDIEELLISQPSCAEEGLDIVENLIRSGGVDLIVVDSVAALTPRAELEGTMEDQHIGRQARLMSQFFRKTKEVLMRSKTHLLMINQLRSKIGIMYGNPETCVTPDTKIEIKFGG